MRRECLSSPHIASHVPLPGLLLLLSCLAGTVGCTGTPGPAYQLAVLGQPCAGPYGCVAPLVCFEGTCQAAAVADDGTAADLAEVVEPDALAAADALVSAEVAADTDLADPCGPGRATCSPDGGPDADPADAAGSTDVASVDAPVPDGVDAFVADQADAASGGSCQGKCGVYKSGAPCQCDPECVGYGDCCADHAALCTPPADDASDVAETDGGVGDLQAPDSYDASQADPFGGDANPASCKGKCGVYDAKAPCQCDAECGQYGDCCADLASLCGTLAADAVGTDAETIDSGGEVDTPDADAGVPDTTVPDTAIPDAAIPDAAVMDGTGDAAVTDTSGLDGSLDAGADGAVATTPGWSPAGPTSCTLGVPKALKSKQYTIYSQFHAAAVDGDLLLAWQLSLSGPLYLQRFGTDAAEKSAPALVSNCCVEHDEGTLGMAVNGQTALVAWQNDKLWSSSYAVHKTDGTKVVGPTALDDGSRPMVVAGGQGFGVATTDNKGLFFTRFDAAGQRLDKKPLVLKGDSGHGAILRPGLAWSGKAFGVAWREAQYSNEDYQGRVYFARVGPDGQVLTPPVDVSAFDKGVIGCWTYPALSFAHGRFVLTYLYLPKGPGTSAKDLSLRMRVWEEATGTWLPGEEIIALNQYAWGTREMAATHLGMLIANDWQLDGWTSHTLLALAGPEGKPIAPAWHGLPVGGMKLYRAQPLQVGKELFAVTTSGNMETWALQVVPIACPATGLCAPGVAQGCDDGNLCTSDNCDYVAGCQHVPNSLACDDGTACTTGENCVGGACKAGLPCDDGDPCTVDACDAAQACSHTVKDMPCDDGVPCTTGDACAAGTCKGQPKTCDDANPCTVDACNPKSGACTHAADMLPCDDGNPCTVDGCNALADPKSACVHVEAGAGAACIAGCTVGACEAATCKSSGTPAVWLKDVDSYGELLAVAPGLGGDLVYAGATFVNYEAKASVGRVTGGGTTVWHAVFPKSGTAAAGVVALADGGALAVGAVKTDLKTKGWLGRVAGNGSIVWSSELAQPAGSALTAAAADGQGGAVAVGYETVGTDKAGVLLRVDASGKVAWTSLGTWAKPGELVDVLAEPAGTFLACGSQWGAGADVVLVRFDGQGQILWQMQVPGTAARYCRALAEAPGGFAIAAGGLPGQAWVMRTDAAGKLLWETRVGEKYTAGLEGIAAEPDGSLVLAGHRKTGDWSTFSEAWFLRVTPTGLVAQENVLTGPGDESWADLVPAAGGGYALAGLRSNYSLHWIPSLGRVDAWGTASCGASDTCSALPAAACSDGNPCTTDTCAAAGGCKHTPLDDVPCGAGFACDVGWCLAKP